MKELIIKKHIPNNDHNTIRCIFAKLSRLHLLEEHYNVLLEVKKYNKSLYQINENDWSYNYFCLQILKFSANSLYDLCYFNECIQEVEEAVIAVNKLLMVNDSIKFKTIYLELLLIKIKVLNATSKMDDAILTLSQALNYQLKTKILATNIHKKIRTELLNNLGNSLALFGEFNRAIKVYRKALRYQHNQQLTKCKNGKLLRAKLLFNTSCSTQQIDPKSEKLKKLKKLVLHYQYSNHLLNNKYQLKIHILTLLHLGWFYLNIGEYNLCKLYLDKCLSIVHESKITAFYPLSLFDHVDALKAYFHYYLGLDSLDKAVDTYYDLVCLFNDSADIVARMPNLQALKGEFTLQLATEFGDRGDYKNALQIYNKLLESYKQKSLSTNEEKRLYLILISNYSNIYMQLGNYLKSISGFEYVQALLNQWGKAIISQGLELYFQAFIYKSLCYYSLEEYDKALQGYIEAINFKESNIFIESEELTQDMVILNANIGLAYSTKNNLPKALEHMYKALNLLSYSILLNSRLGRYFYFQVLIDIGAIYQDYTKYNNAIELYTQAELYLKEHISETEKTRFDKLRLIYNMIICTYRISTYNDLLLWLQKLSAEIQRPFIFQAGNWFELLTEIADFLIKICAMTWVIRNYFYHIFNSWTRRLTETSFDINIVEHKVYLNFLREYLDLAHSCNRLDLLPSILAALHGRKLLDITLADVEQQSPKRADESEFQHQDRLRLALVRQAIAEVRLKLSRYEKNNPFAGDFDLGGRSTPIMPSFGEALNEAQYQAKQQREQTLRDELDQLCDEHQSILARNEQLAILSGASALTTKQLHAKLPINDVLIILAPTAEKDSQQLGDIIAYVVHHTLEQGMVVNLNKQLNTIANHLLNIKIISAGRSLDGLDAAVNTTGCWRNQMREDFDVSAIPNQNITDSILEKTKASVVEEPPNQQNQTKPSIDYTTEWIAEVELQVQQYFWQPIEQALTEQGIHLNTIQQLHICTMDELYGLPLIETKATTHPYAVNVYTALPFFIKADHTQQNHDPQNLEQIDRSQLLLSTHASEHLLEGRGFLPGVWLEEALINTLWQPNIQEAQSYCEAQSDNLSDTIESTPISKRTNKLAHFSCHGQHNSQQVLESKLELRQAWSCHEIMAAYTTPKQLMLGACLAGKMAADSEGDPLGIPSAFQLRQTQLVVGAYTSIPDGAMAWFDVLVHWYIRQQRYSLRQAVLQVKQDFKHQFPKEFVAYIQTQNLVEILEGLIQKRIGQLNDVQGGITPQGVKQYIPTMLISWGQEYIATKVEQAQWLTWVEQHKSLWKIQKNICQEDGHPDIQMGYQLSQETKVTVLRDAAQKMVALITQSLENYTPTTTDSKWTAVADVVRVFGK